MDYDWSKFDEIYCINLVEREDRYDQAKLLFDSLHIPVTFRRVHKHKNGEQGCFESHRDIIKKAYDKGHERILILEDDIVTGKSLTPENMSIVNNFLNTINDWEIFYLGMAPMIMKHKTEKIQKDIYRVHALNAHAYVVSRKFMKRFKDAEYLNIPVDMVYSASEKAYGFYPSMFYQGNSSSDIQNGSGIQSGGLLYQKFVETYSVNVNYEGEKLMIILVIAFILLLIIYFVNPTHKILSLILILVTTVLVIGLVT